MNYGVFCPMTTSSKFTKANKEDFMWHVMPSVKLNIL